MFDTLDLQLEGGTRVRAFIISAALAVLVCMIVAATIVFAGHPVTGGSLVLVVEASLLGPDWERRIDYLRRKDPEYRVEIRAFTGGPPVDCGPIPGGKIFVFRNDHLAVPGNSRLDEQGCRVIQLNPHRWQEDTLWHEARHQVDGHVGMPRIPLIGIFQALILELMIDFEKFYKSLQYGF
jgi:hypothetical protein